MRELSFQIPDYVTVETEKGKKAAECEKSSRLTDDANSVKYICDDVEVVFDPCIKGLNVTVTARESALEYLKLRWKIQAPAHVRILGDAWERGYGDLEWRGLCANRVMPWYFLEKTQDKTYGYGVKVRPSAMCFWEVDSKGITLVMDVRCGGSGVLLNGRWLEAATIIACESEEEDSFSFAKAFCRSLCEDPIFPPHPVYGANNWYYAYGESSEEEILSDTDALMELTKDLKNPPYMVIDDCWQKLRTPEYIGGPWSEGNAKFPDMKGLAKKIREKGARPGIWLRFLLNKDEQIKDEWRLSHNGCLDPSHPDALAFIKEDVRRTCLWGYELIKHDFSTYDLFGKWGFEMNPDVTLDGWHFYDRGKTSAEVVKMLYEAIYEASLETGTLILGCNTIGHLGAGLMQMNRTGDDTSGVNWERTRIMGINTLAFRLPQHRTFYDVDADCVGIMGTIPWSLNRQWADVIAESGTSLFVSAKPGVLSEEEKQELAAIFARASVADHHREPVDWEDTTCPEIWKEQDKITEYCWYEERGGILECKQDWYRAQIVKS